MINYTTDYNNRLWFQHIIGRRLADETVRIVDSFYQVDEYPSQMPGQRDYISIARNVHIQKKLIQTNSKELFAEFKVPSREGFNEFTETSN